MTRRRLYTGKALLIDLPRLQSSVIESPGSGKQNLGGGDYAATWLKDRAPRLARSGGFDTDLVITTGPLTGTLVPGSGQCCVFGRSPSGGGMDMALLCSGFGPELKCAGYDHILILGCAEKPVWLSIRDHEVVLHSADSLWGSDTQHTEQKIREELGDPQVQCLSIGPAGENGTLSATLIGGPTTAEGFPGLGSIWGAKNLKAISVRGTGGVGIADPDRFYRECVSLQGHFRGVQEQSARGAAPFFTGEIPFMERGGGASARPRKALVRVADRPVAVRCYNCPSPCFIEVSTGLLEESFLAVAGPLISRLGLLDPEFWVTWTQKVKRCGLDPAQVIAVLSQRPDLDVQDAVAERVPRIRGDGDASAALLQWVDELASGKEAKPAHAPDRVGSGAPRNKSTVRGSLLGVCPRFLQGEGAITDEVLASCLSAGLGRRIERQRIEEEERRVASLLAPSC